MRISDWSSDVCSSDLGNRAARRFPLRLRRRSRAGTRPRGARSRLRAGARRARGRYRLLRRALMLTELNFDGIIGTRPHYAGTSPRHLADTSKQRQDTYTPPDTPQGLAQKAATNQKKT